MDSVDNLFLQEIFKKSRWSWLQDLGWSEQKIEAMTTSAKSLTGNDTWLFTHAPRYAYLQGEMPEDAVAAYRACKLPASKMEEYIWTPLRGTTFSGHTTKTTLGNTLRTMSYALYYMHRAGLAHTFEQAERRGMTIMASGDDLVIFGSEA
jgi:hypothetical protein